MPQKKMLQGELHTLQLPYRNTLLQMWYIMLTIMFTGLEYILLKYIIISFNMFLYVIIMFNRFERKTQG